MVLDIDGEIVSGGEFGGSETISFSLPYEAPTTTTTSTTTVSCKS